MGIPRSLSCEQSLYASEALIKLFGSPVTQFNIKQMSEKHGIKGKVNIKIKVKNEKCHFNQLRACTLECVSLSQADGAGLRVRDWLANILSPRDRISNISGCVGV